MSVTGSGRKVRFNIDDDSQGGVMGESERVISLSWACVRGGGETLRGVTMEGLGSIFGGDDERVVILVCSSIEGNEVSLVDDVLEGAFKGQLKRLIL
ncbi:hypothetical protein Tco_1313819 [Tanacetum coccineum]